jgi:hypothetical protein
MQGRRRFGNGVAVPSLGRRNDFYLQGCHYGGVTMPLEAILREIGQLHNISTRLEALAELHPQMSEGLITIAETVRNAAGILELLVATKGPKPI